jgi:N-hydroxyarylamine O-acetyltransferase
MTTGRASTSLDTTSPDTTSPATSRPLTAGERAAYLDRIGATAPPEPTSAALAALQLAHLTSVPFENLDVARGHRFGLTVEDLVSKVLTARRGGYCYELNGLFALLLESLGYDVVRLGARVSRGDGRWGPERDHLTLRVSSPAMAEPELVDVGFGDAWIAPLPLRDGFSRRERRKVVALERFEDGWLYSEDTGAGPAPQFAFTEEPLGLADFEDMNVWQQTSPDSGFTGRRVCSLLTADGRVTLANDRLIETGADGRTEETVDPADVPVLLRERFGVELV